MIPRTVPLRDEALFAQAMRHRSAIEDSAAESYERLEFFGDSVLGLVIAEYLYSHHPDWDQGMMSKAKASLVQEAPLAEVALRLGFDASIELSPSEDAGGGRSRPSILADVFEAVVGAIYIESGMEKARWFVLEQLHPFLMQVSGGDVSPHDHKSRLQETAQGLWRKTPVYRVVSEQGHAHEKRFLVQVVFDQEVMGEGAGRNKKEAEQAAALDALELIERNRRGRKEPAGDEAPF
jgi:ribonuclease-3